MTRGHTHTHPTQFNSNAQSQSELLQQARKIAGVMVMLRTSDSANNYVYHLDDNDTMKNRL